MDPLVPRRAGPLLASRLAAFRGVVLQGPRQSGKTTLLSTHAPASGRLVSFDEPPLLAAALDDPTAMASIGMPLLVDEFQRAGEPFLLAVKRRLDRDRRRGQVVLTGSANYLTSTRVSETLAGRVGLVDLLPLSVGERFGLSERFPTMLRRGPDALRGVEPVQPYDYAPLVVAGGFPEVVTAIPEGSRRAWFDAYVQTVIDREVRTLSAISGPDDMRRVVGATAALAGAPLVLSSLASELGMNRQTLTQYLSLLERVFLVTRLPGWSTGSLGSLTKAPRYHLVDSGLAGALRGFGADRLADPLFSPAGGLWETFAVNEIRKQLAWLDLPPRLNHLRDKAGRHEIDLIVEWPDGRLAGVEVKRTASPGRGAFDSLRYLRDRLGPRFIQGVVLCAVPEPVPFGDRLTALPLATLWS